MDVAHCAGQQKEIKMNLYPTIDEFECPRYKCKDCIHFKARLPSNDYKGCTHRFDHSKWSMPILGLFLAQRIMVQFVQILNLMGCIKPHFHIGMVLTTI